MSKTIKSILIFSLTAVFAITSCEQSAINSPSVDETIVSQDLGKDALMSDINVSLQGINGLDDINDRLADSGLHIELAYAETVTLGENGEESAGQTIFANDRELRLGAQWVPGDERRFADGNNLNYVVFEPFSFANGIIDSEPAIDASFDTWNNVKKNSKLNIIKRADTGVFPSFILGGDPFVADISEVGFLPGFLFDIILEDPEASENVLGVTFTFIFLDAPADEGGVPTDINNDGFDDIALKEVWYNDDFEWTTDPSGPGIDIETVALHENGHALGFGHFGKISVTNEGMDNAKLHVSPRAVMNALILGDQRDLLGTDKASYNSIYGSWPK